MGAPEQNGGSGTGDAPEQGRGPSSGGGAGVAGLAADASGVDYAWLQQQLAGLGLHLGDVRAEDELEDEEDWQDPTGGVLTAVLEACEADAPEELAQLLQQLADGGWDPNVPGPDGDTALHIAALYGSEACVDQLLAAGAAAATTNPEDGTTPFHDAAAGGYDSILTKLAAAAARQLPWVAATLVAPADGPGDDSDSMQRPAGADEGGARSGTGDGGAELAAIVNLRDAEGETALHAAARGNHLSTVRLLLLLGADALLAAQGGALPEDEAEEEAVVALLRGAAGTERAVGSRE